MKKGLLGYAAVACGGFAAMAGVLFALGSWSYQRLNQSEHEAERAWLQVENLYRQRADLIPHLVASVRSLKSAERQTLIGVVEARSRVKETWVHGSPDADELASFQLAQDALIEAVESLCEVVEGYPELADSEAFQSRRSELRALEVQIAAAREHLHHRTVAFNTLRRSIPTVVVARFLGVAQRPHLETSGETVP